MGHAPDCRVSIGYLFTCYLTVMSVCGLWLNDGSIGCTASCAHVIPPMQCCPRDGENLSVHRTARGAVVRCGACAGLWLPGKMVVRHVGQLPRLAFIRDLGVATDLLCPDDGVALVVLMHHGVKIDVCTKCEGVWLDQGELEHILLRRYGPSYHPLKPTDQRKSSFLGRADVPPDVLADVMEAIGDFLGGLWSP